MKEINELYNSNSWSCDDEPATHQELRQSEWYMGKSIHHARKVGYLGIWIGIADAVAIVVHIIVTVVRL